jgi:membrane associated rhomboid family serine protease
VAEQVVDVPVTRLALARREFPMALDAGEPAGPERTARVRVPVRVELHGAECPHLDRRRPVEFDDERVGALAAPVGPGFARGFLPAGRPGAGMARRSPTLTLVVVFVAVYLVELLVGAFGVPKSAFALATPVTLRPWTLVTSVYAHGSVGHLLANSVGLVLVGLVLERRTSRERFHLFFLVTGSLAGLSQVWVAGFFGVRLPVLGASGAVFALVGYVLAGNRVSDTILSAVPLSGRAQLAVFVVLAAALTLLTASQGVALVAHFTGLLLGLLAGRDHVLRP